MQKDLHPILLRRMKEDVEDLPEKEEVIVWVELTRQQRVYYKALFTQQVQKSHHSSKVLCFPRHDDLCMRSTPPEHA